MFEIKISMRQYDTTGLDALDERRRLHLSEGTQLSTEYGRCAWRTATISEIIARQYFDRTTEIDEACIPLALVTSEDVDEGLYPQVRLRLDLRTERIVELYVAAQSL